MLHLSRELLLRIEEAERQCWITYLSGVQKITNNPIGVEISSIGRSTAFLVKSTDSEFFNKALGFGSEHIDYIDALLEFYHSNEKRCIVEIIPLPEHSELQLALAQKGLYNSEQTSMLFRELDEKSYFDIDTDLTIERVDQSQSNLLADIHVRGFEFHGEDAIREHKIVKEGYNNDKFKCYVAKKDGKHIGAGTLFISDNVGVLFGGATIPEFRGKGCQSILLKHRINEAIQFGCNLLISHTNLYTGSQRNLERVGFHLASNRARWTDYPMDY